MDAGLHDPHNINYCVRTGHVIDLFSHAITIHTRAPTRHTRTLGPETRELYSPSAQSRATRQDYYLILGP